MRRLVRYGRGLNPFGPVTDEDLALLSAALRAAGRDLSELEGLVGGIRGVFESADAVADVDRALADLRRQLDQGFTTICSSPRCSALASMRCRHCAATW